MTCIRYVTTSADRKCRLCGDLMARDTWGIVLSRIHVPPKLVDLHFHEGCFMRALDAAKSEHGTTTTKATP